VRDEWENVLENVQAVFSRFDVKYQMKEGEMTFSGNIYEEMKASGQIAPMTRPELRLSLSLRFFSNSGKGGYIAEIKYTGGNEELSYFFDIFIALKEATKNN